jgi:ATP-dependent Lhr-like helicase
VSGRWSLLPAAETDQTVRALATAEQLLERHGVVTRGAVVNEGIRGGFSTVYKVLSRFEESGRARRGYFIEGLGAAQFATGATVDRLRAFTRQADAPPELAAVTVTATDPANPYGAALGWPKTDGTHRPGRKAGALVVLVDGDLALYIERGGKTTLTFTSDEAVLAAAAESLAAGIRRSVGKLKVERANGEFVIGTPLGTALTAAGFSTTPQGLRLRA